MAFGQRVGSMKTLKQTLQKGGGGNAWIKYIPKNGNLNVRFIQEPEEWVNYVEHYDMTLRKSYPCNGEASCPGCNSGERKSYRYLANAVDIESDRAIPLQLPKDLANRLVVKYEKWGTLIDRDIELTRSGEGLDTVYDLDAGVPSRMKIDKYTPLDLLKVLDDAFRDVFGGGTDDDEDEKPKAAVKMRAKSAAAAKVDDPEDEEEAPTPKPAAKRAAKKAPVKAAPKAPEFEPEDDDEADDDEDIPDALLSDSERASRAAEKQDDGPDVDDDDDDDDEEGYSEEQLQALPLGALRAVARDFDVDTKGKNAKAIIAEIMSSGD